MVRGGGGEGRGGTRRKERRLSIAVHRDQQGKRDEDAPSEARRRDYYSRLRIDNR